MHTIACVVLSSGCAPTVSIDQSGKSDGAVPSEEQFYDAVTAPVKRSDDKEMITFFNCSEFWKVQCKPRQHGRVDCRYQVSRVSWDHAIFARDSAGMWRWIGGDRLCPWTGKKSL